MSLGEWVSCSENDSMRIIRIIKSINTARHAATALCLVLAGTAGAAETRPPLTLAGPASVVSFPLLHMIDSGALKSHADRVTFRLWQNPDQLRVLLANGQVDYTAAPANLPALLANRGEPVRLLNISVWGQLWLVSRDPLVRRYADLSGKVLLTSFSRDLPAILLDEVLRAERVAGKVTLRRSRDMQDAVALMLAGQADHAVLGEPMASLLLWRNARAGGAPLYRSQSLASAWREAFPGQPALPQAGLMASSRRAPDLALSRAVEHAYAASARWCAAQPRACAELTHRHLPQLPVAAIEASIRVTRLDSRPASEVRPQLEALYRLIADKHPQAIGGRLPDVGFYGP